MRLYGRTSSWYPGAASGELPIVLCLAGGVDSLRVQLGLSTNAIAEKIKKISGNYSEGIRE